MGHTHRGRLVPKEVDGVKSLVIKHIEAVALVPALWEDVKADHATCQEKGGHQAVLLGAGRVSPDPGMGRRMGGGWMSEGSPYPKQQPQPAALPWCSSWHVARIVAEAVPMTTGCSDISMAGVTLAQLPCRQAGTSGFFPREASSGGDFWSCLADSTSTFCVPTGNNDLGDWHQSLSQAPAWTSPALLKPLF